MKDQELIDLLKQQAKEIADANINGYGNTMLEAANRLEQLVMPTPKKIRYAIVNDKNGFIDGDLVERKDKIFINLPDSFSIHKFEIRDMGSA